MATTSDIRDIMNLGQAGPRQPAPKKKKHSEPQVRMTGINREVQALMGDSVPPIAIVDQSLYKPRPSLARSFVPRHWEEKQFQHGGRADGLILKHWKRAIPGSNQRRPLVADLHNSGDVEMSDESKATPTVQEYSFEEEYPSHKWNISVSVASYTDEQYQNFLKSEEWTKEETDYLMELCRGFDLRWLLIADRYDPTEILPSTTSLEPEHVSGTEVIPQPQYPVRSMEALKSRYYAIAAKMLEIHTPASTMTSTEFQLWEKMRNFDVKTETMRKAMAEKLFERTKDEADEERILLEELHRITKNEDDFIKMRRDLYARLEPVAPIRRGERGEEQSTAMYQTSQGLSMLLQSLLAKEKRLKRPPVPGGAEAGPAANTPADNKSHEKGRHNTQHNRRDTIDTNTEESAPGPQKKGSTSQPVVRVLTPQEEARFGVSHPTERVTSGVQFRHEKISRLTMAKSQTQTSKILAALTELGIPPRLLMPTERVCREFERLTSEINILLDTRKVNEKITTEIKILEEARRIRLGQPKEGEQDTNAKSDAMDVDSSQVVEDSQLEHTQIESQLVADEDQDAEGEEDVVEDKQDETQLETQEEDKTNLENDGSKLQLDVEAEKDDDDDADGDEDEDDEGDTTTITKQVNADSDDEEDEDEDEETGVAEESEQEDEDAGEEKDEDEDEDEESEEDDRPPLGVDNDEDEEEEEDDAVVAETPSVQDAEQDDEDEDEEEEEENNESEAAEAEDDAEDSGSDAEAEAETQSAAPDNADEEAEEDSPNLAPVSAAVLGGGRGHKRSASVISEASKAGSNRSGLGRKKR
ncbi:hypothetical protein LTR84_001455 [Exophiala bonariae]|uniref:SWR1-complex protein 4 n=1 Tax=Exophiala bonariae TaxID=1690606 RepID=A0AAV9NCT0_9EURO|nr:hypothetical protein LTR84_001455 [Exophiala bonariae]